VNAGACLDGAALRAPASPFDLADGRAYRRWRAAKLAVRPRGADDLVVDVADPRALTPAEVEALSRRVAAANMAVYRSASTTAGKELARALGARLGLHRLDANWLADEDGVSSITARSGSARGEFVPYTAHAIRWHTDGYYHPAERRIRAMVLHCVRPARAGGVNALVDHELLYIALRDADPALVRALMAHDAMTIPAREGDGSIARPAQTGPVFSLDAEGALHLRYTARTRSIAWKDDAATRAAVDFVDRWLASEPPGLVRLALGPGMGIVANNVLHDRSAFEDDPGSPRLLLRARFLDRIRTAAPWPSG
jgi:hypothetical protein